MQIKQSKFSKVFFFSEEKESDGSQLLWQAWTFFSTSCCRSRYLFRIIESFESRKIVRYERYTRIHVENIVKGVTKVSIVFLCVIVKCSLLMNNSIDIYSFSQSYMYEMRAVYAYFPINSVTTENKSTIVIRSFVRREFH